ncbi:hypothetical protein NG796_11920 [Laspinema sp. A4]|uniref:hypothetical protein n=1 Tax=Laspinema sp. D2d TaxID=2953686 RepID=UPI0021BADF6F|nr:hypothetical protein [Laspinema sp. D2d]MCT7984006.1 hypothetical protein [Laspinema sp. D2d]
MILKDKTRGGALGKRLLALPNKKLSCLPEGIRGCDRRSPKGWPNFILQKGREKRKCNSLQRYNERQLKKLNTILKNLNEGIINQCAWRSQERV